MLRLVKVLIHNLCQYSDAEIPIGDGLNAVCGRNGSGKTSLLRILVYGLTGMVDGSYGTQTTLQKDGTSDPGRVTVILDSHDGVSYRIVRYSSTGSSKCHDRLYKTECGVETEVAVRRKPVSEALFQLFGISEQLMFQLCWGRQSRLDALLTGTANEISGFLSGLFDTALCDKIRDKIKVQADTIAALSPACRDYAEQAREGLAALPDDAELQSAVEHLEREREALEGSVGALKAKLAGKPERQVRPRIEYLEEQLAVVAASPDIAPERPSGERPDAPDMSRRRSACARLDAARRRLSVVKSERSDAEKAAAAARRSIADAEAGIRMLDEKLSSSGDTCALCGGHVVDRSRYANYICSMITGCDSRDAFVRSANESIRASEDVVESSADSIARLDEAAGSLEAEILELEAGIEAEDESLQRFAAWQSYDAEMARHGAAVAYAGRMRTELEELRDTVTYSEGDAESLRAASAELKSVSERLDAAKSERSECAANRKYLQKALEDAEAQVAKLEINTAAREAFAELRDVFSSKRAQARYLKNRIAALNARLSSYLSGTGMPFSLYLDEDDHIFKYMTADGFTHPASHLSGAQKNISAVVLQMALFEIAHPRINLFLVDEPSESLDVENKILLAGLFDRMNSLLPSIQGTMLIVTRDDVVVDCCRTVINVSEV